MSFVKFKSNQNYLNLISIDFFADSFIVWWIIYPFFLEINVSKISIFFFIICQINLRSSLIAYVFS